jgi:hypothetical protein
MAFTEVPNGYKVSNDKRPLDGRTYYNTIAEALADNPYTVTIETLPPSNTPTEVIETNRFIGQKVMIQNPPEGGSPCEYWFKDGIADSDLVKYTSEHDDSYEWEKVDAFGGGSGGGGGVSVGTVTLSNVSSYLINPVFKSKVLGFANDSYKLVYFTISAGIIRDSNLSLSNHEVGTLSVAPAADTAISVYCCNNSVISKGRIMDNGDIRIHFLSKNDDILGSNIIIISGCFVTGAT